MSPTLKDKADSEMVEHFTLMDIRSFRRRNLSKIVVGHLNINRYTYDIRNKA